MPPDGGGNLWYNISTRGYLIIPSVLSINSITRITKFSRGTRVNTLASGPCSSFLFSGRLSLPCGIASPPTEGRPFTRQLPTTAGSPSRGLYHRPRLFRLFFCRFSNSLLSCFISSFITSTHSGSSTTGSASQLSTGVPVSARERRTAILRRIPAGVPSVAFPPVARRTRRMSPTRLKKPAPR